MVWSESERVGVGNFRAQFVTIFRQENKARKFNKTYHKRGHIYEFNILRESRLFAMGVIS